MLFNTKEMNKRIRGLAATIVAGLVLAGVKMFILDFQNQVLFILFVVVALLIEGAMDNQPPNPEEQ